VARERYATEAGDVQKTGGTTERANRLLGWEPRVSLREGLAAQLEWSRSRLLAPTVQAV
jgi:nucleoside-diphosphate-sugar epimerase